MNHHFIRTFLFVFLILFFYVGCRHTSAPHVPDEAKFLVPTKIVDIEDIKPPTFKTLKKPEVSRLGSPIRHNKKKRAAPNMTIKEVDFVLKESTLVTPNQPHYPSTTIIHSKPTIANPPKYGPNASEWKDVKNNCLHLTEKEGLLMTSNDALFQDQKGNIWGCTQWGGAWKYDGYQFVNYYKHIGLEDYSVRNLFFDSDGEVWFGMSFGLAKFDGTLLTHYTGEDEISKNRPTKFAEDDIGNIWIGSMDGLYRLNKKENSITHFTKENGLLKNEISGLHRDHSGQIWITYNNTGLSLLSVEIIDAGYTYQFKHYIPSEISLFNNVQCLYQKNKDQLFIGTNNGFIQIQSNTIGSSEVLKATHYLSDPIAHIFSIAQGQSGQLYVGTDLHLLILDFDENDQIDDMSIMTTEDGLISNRVSGILIDQENYLWAAHNDIGISKIDLNQPFRSIGHDYGIQGAGIGGLEDNWQNVWFSVNGLLYCLREDEDAKSKYLQQYGRGQNITIDHIYDMTIDHDGNIWMGGLNKVKGEFNIIKLELSDKGNMGIVNSYSSEQGLELLNISDLMTDDAGDIWISENTLSLFNKVGPSKGGGVYKLEGDKLWHFGKEQGLMSSDTHLSIQDKQGNYWFNSIYHGITKFEPKSNDRPDKWIHYEFGQSTIFMGTHDSDGIWTNAQGGRLVHLPSKIDTPIQESKQFIIKGHEWDLNYVGTYMTDVEKNTWVGYPNGLFKIRKKTDYHLENSPYIENYTKLDGIPYKYPGLMFQTKDSTIFFSAIDQFISFRPQDLIEDQKKKEVVLHKVSLFNEDIKWEQGKEIELKDNQTISDFHFDGLSKWTNIPQNLSLRYQDNYIGFEYSTIEIDRPHKVEFRHFLEGFENDWNIPTKDRKISYPNLPYGNFTLNISARIDDAEWGVPIKYKFKIRPPWWYTWWAYSFYFILVFSMLYAFYQYRINRKLEKAEAYRLKELDAVKTRLYTNITHEFRTPLTVISGMADQISDNPEKWSKTGLSMIRRNTKRLLELVNQMLDLSKLESGKISLKNQQSDIISYLKYIVESIHSYATTINIKVHFLSEEDEIIMDFDPENIQRVIMNLLSNALKFTNKNGDVYISARRQPSIGKAFDNNPILNIMVKDTGSGIPEDQLPFIFDRFYQVDDTETREGEGTGVGLALVKELIKLMGGEISVRSKLNEGTVFTILLPIRNVEKEIDIILQKPNKDNKVSQRLEINKLQQSEKTFENTNGKPRILLIEDNADVVAYIASCLNGDYDILVAVNGQEGIEIATEYIPDLIVSDVMMPIKDGFEVTKTLKYDLRTNHIPIIMLTAKADINSKLEGLQKGADAYLSKPFHKDELLIRIKKLLELRNNLQQHYLSIVTSDAPPNQDKIVQEDQFVIKLREVINSHLSDFDFSVEQLCKEMTMSSSQLHRKVTALTGLSPNKFLRYIRLTKAKKMLRDSDDPINVIAYETGFSDPSYFGRVFKKEFGMTPIEWRGNR